MSITDRWPKNVRKRLFARIKKLAEHRYVRVPITDNMTAEVNVYWSDNGPEAASFIDRETIRAVKGASAGVRQLAEKLRSPEGYELLGALNDLAVKAATKTRHQMTIEIRRLVKALENEVKKYHEGPELTQRQLNRIVKTIVLRVGFHG